MSVATCLTNVCGPAIFISSKFDFFPTEKCSSDISLFIYPFIIFFHCLQSSVYALTISPDGQYLVSAGEDRRIRLWDLTAGSMIKELRGHTDTVYSLAFSADGTLLSSGGLDNSVKVWDFGQAVKTSSNGSSSVSVSPELMASFPTKNCSVHCVQFSSCNLILAAGTQSPWRRGRKTGQETSLNTHRLFEVKLILLT